jgi:hypothetical protein
MLGFDAQILLHHGRVTGGAKGEHIHKDHCKTRASKTDNDRLKRVLGKLSLMALARPKQ